MKLNPLGSPLMKMAIRVEHDVVSARQKARRLSMLLGFDNQDQVRLATAVSELARNVYQYVGSGMVEFFFEDHDSQTLNIKISDQGHGIKNLDEVLSGQYVSQSGLGVGLLGTKKLMDSFDLQSGPSGTVIVIGKALPARNRKVRKEDIPILIDQLIAKGFENPFEEMQNQNRDLLLALQEVRAAREELSELNRELAETNRGVVALYAELDEKAVSLQKANEVKTSFLSNMTHEFRTPISSVISLTRMLLSETDGVLNDEQKKQVNYIRKSSETVLQLVSNLLDLAKVEAGRVVIDSSPFYIEEILGGLRGVFRPILNNLSDVEFNIEPVVAPFELQTDEGKISQILRNLISNAVKFTEKGTITVKTHVDDVDRVHFCVIDTGIGIDEKYYESIFEDFSQIESSLQKKHKGTGLGLPLSRKLARLLGGDLTVESHPREGSTFHLIVPRIYRGDGEGVLISNSTVHGGAGSVGVETDSPPSESFRVLMIDDDEVSRTVLKKLVRKEIHASFAETTDGKRGLDQMKKWRPDLVFLDLAMPGMDGFEVLKRAKMDPALRDIPIIVNTAKKLNAVETQLISESAAFILSKERSDPFLATQHLKEALGKAGFDYRQDIP